MLPDYMEIMSEQISLDGAGRWASELPEFVLRDGTVLPLEAVRSVVKTLSTTGPVQKFGKRRTKNRVVFAGHRAALRAALLGLRDDMTTKSARAVGQALLGLWKESRYDEKMRWCAWGAGVLGDDAVALGIYDEMRALLRKKWGYKKATALFDVLLSIDSDMAYMTIASFAREQPHTKLGQQAVEYVEEAAKRLGVSVEQLEDQVIPMFGCDRSGRVTFDYGTRSFEAGVGANFYPVLRDDSGKQYKSLPKARKSEDADSIEEMRLEWKTLQRGLVHIFRVQAPRLERMMIERRRWELARWQRHVLEHPFMVLFARNLLWGVWEDGALVSTFRVAQDNTLADAADELFTLPERGRVGLVHRLDLSDELAASWGEVFTDYELIAPFAQLGRMVCVVNPGAAKATQLEDIARHGPISPRAVRTFMKYNGFSREYDGECYGREIGEWYVRLNITPGLAHGSYEYDTPQEVVGVDFWHNSRQPRPLAEVPPIVFSEGRAWAESLAAKAHDAVDR